MRYFRGYQRMKQFGASLKTSLTAGLLVLFPLFACGYVIVVVVTFLTDLIKPLLTNVLPQAGIFYVALTDAVSIFILLAFCVVVGVIAKTNTGGALTSRADQLLCRIPGYRMFERISQIVFDHDDASGTPVVVDRGDSRQLGFMMEEIGEEMVVFFPEAPGVISGSVEIVRSSTVRKLSVPPVRLARVIATYGAGTQALLADRVSDRDQSRSNVRI